MAARSSIWGEKRTDLKRKWINKFSKVGPAKKAAQFLQIENQIDAALDLQPAAAPRSRP